MVTVSAQAYTSVGGNIGDSATWVYNEEDSTLNIVGKGCLFDYNEFTQRPWNEMAGDIRKIYVSKDITYVGAFIFSEFKGVEITFNSIPKFGKNAVGTENYIIVSIDADENPYIYWNEEYEYDFYDNIPLFNKASFRKSIDSEKRYGTLTLPFTVESLDGLTIYYISGFDGKKIYIETDCQSSILNSCPLIYENTGNKDEISFEIENFNEFNPYPMNLFPVYPVEFYGFFNKKSLDGTKKMYTIDDELNIVETETYKPFECYISFYADPTSVSGHKMDMDSKVKIGLNGIVNSNFGTVSIVGNRKYIGKK